MIRALAPTDRLERDGRVLLLFDRQLVEPSPLTEAILSLAHSWIALPALTAALVRTFGLPPEGEPEAVVDAVVDELVRRGVVERNPEGWADPR